MGIAENHVQDLDLDDAAERLLDIRSQSHSSQPQSHSQSQSQSRSIPVNWNLDNHITPPLQTSSSSPFPTHRFHPDMTALDILNLLWGDSLYHHIAHHTNLYAQQKQQQQPDATWHDVDADEIRTLFGMFVYMSVVKLPAFVDYWSTQPFLDTPIIHNVMPRNRAHKLLQYLHANTNINNEQRDPLHKIEPIIAHLTHSFASSFRCGTKQCIDEVMIAYRGRTHFIQYMPKKRVRYGIKVWCRADSESAFISQIQIYFGK